jgi:CRISPR-associated endonuclease/helicase Cas3
MATARQMENRVSKFLAGNDVEKALLVHSQAWLETDIEKSEEIDKSWFVPTKRSLLANYGVGTVDQAMMSVLRIKQGVLRLLGLSGKVLVIDEVHAYDTYMQTIIYRLLKWCVALDIPVIILSATLPKERKKQIINACDCNAEIKADAYPLITIAKSDGQLYEHAVNGSYIERKLQWENIEFTEHKDIALKALEAIKEGGCACVIMNTVKDAQKVFKEAKRYAGSDTELMLFHSKFLLKDRKDIENQCLSKFGNGSVPRPKKALLVATQVVEQSLDVDFDYMISALAPIDLLLQRSGRIHRHSRKRPEALNKPHLTVIVNKDEAEDSGIGRIYNTWILRQTQTTIQKIEGSVHIPDDIRRLIEEVYGAAPQLNDVDLQLWLKLKSIEELDKGIAKNVIFPVPYDDWFFPLETGEFFDETDSSLICSDAYTRIGGNEIKIALLPDSLWNDDKLADSDKGYAKNVLDYTVSVIVPQGCQLNSKDLFRCGGYLKGVYAIKGEDRFCLEYYKNEKVINKQYSVNSIYGLEEI